MRIVFILLMISQWAMAQTTIVQLLGIDESHLISVEQQQLTEKTATAFFAMQEAALADGIDIQLVSAFRSFARQQYIWENKFDRYTSEGLTPNEAINRILAYSTIPGTSRHHWGTDIDITDGNATNQKQLLVAEKFHNNGPFAPLHQWMQANAHRFGFYLVYTNNSNRTGFSYEPWHYSYLPEAKAFLNDYEPRTAFAFFKSVGIKGSAYIDYAFWECYYAQFVLGVNKELIEEN